MSGVLIASADENSGVLIARGKAVIDCEELTCDFIISTDSGYTILNYAGAENTKEDDALEKKRVDIKEDRPYNMSSSSRSRQYDLDLLKANKMFEIDSLNFKHNNINLVLNDFSITDDVWVNYNRDCASVIGMNILKKLEFHCAVSRLTSKYTFIGCRKAERDNNIDYERELLRHFGIVHRNFFNFMKREHLCNDIIRAQQIYFS